MAATAKKRKKTTRAKRALSERIQSRKDGTYQAVTPATRIGRNRSDLPIGVDPNAFAKWIQHHGMTVETAASLLDVSVAAIYGYRRGNRPPSLKIAARIEKMTDGEVTARSWG